MTEKFSVKVNLPILHTAKCVNLAIFLSFWFYVKLILADLGRLKPAILTILAALNFEFLEICDIFKCEISSKFNFKASKIVEMAVKIDFT